jgi:hypothetical protein
MPRFGPHIFRGDPVTMILEMSASSGKPVATAKAAIRHLVEDLTKSHKAKVQVPWEQPEATLAKSFIRALLQSGIAQTVADA